MRPPRYDFPQRVASADGCRRERTRLVQSLGRATDRGDRTAAIYLGRRLERLHAVQRGTRARPYTGAAEGWAS